MDPLHHHHHHHAPLHWGYSAAPPQHNTWIPPPTAATAAPITSHHSATSARKLKRTISESDCEDLYSEESSKEQTSPGESDSCHMMSRKKRRGVIEKKRRDRINLSLTELKRLVPSAYEKQGSAKLEKAEILQLTVDHLKSMHGKGPDGMPFDPQRFAVEYHVVGFRECASEVARYLVTMEGMDIQDPLRLRLMSHLQCFVAQRELQLKSSGGAGGAGGLNGPLSPSAHAAASVVNPVSPNHNMNQSTTPLTPSANSHANWMASPSYHHQQGYQMMPTATYQHQNAYASSCPTATAQSGYVPNLPPPLPHQYDQYGSSQQQQQLHGDGSRSASSSSTQANESNNNYGSDSGNTTATGRSGVTTRSQASNSNNSSAAANNDVGNGGGCAEQGGGGVGPTYTDLSSASVVAAVSSATAATSMSSAAAASSVSSSLSGGHNRLQHNYNHYSASAMDSFGGHYHLATNAGYNLHLGASNGGGGGLQSDPSRGYNVSPAGNGNSKPYRPWGAEMAY